MHMTTKALVLRTVDYKESDKILTLLTQEQGKLTASARGCRKKGSAIAAGCQLLAWSEMVLYDYQGRWFVKEAGYYDLVLMDIQMPVMDGYKASRSIRAFEDRRKAAIPILALTANAFQEDREKAAEAGMDGHIPKPLDADKMFQTIAEALRAQ